jgi:hypothetical protein
MAITKEQMRSVGVYNAHNFANGAIFVDYTPRDTGRGGFSAKWQVCWAGHVTDPKAHWADYGKKTFNVFGKDEKETARLEAIAWATEKYGIKEWAKTPFGSYMDAGFVAKRLGELKAAIKEKASAELPSND